MPIANKNLISDAGSPSPIKAPLRRLIVQSLAGFQNVNLGLLAKLSKSEQDEKLAVKAGQLLAFIRQFESDQDVDILDDQSVAVIDEMTQKMSSQMFQPSLITQILADLEPVKELMQFAMVPLKNRVHGEQELRENFENDRIFGEYHVSSSAASDSFSASSLADLQQQLTSPIAYQSAEADLSIAKLSSEPSYRNRTLLLELDLSQSSPQPQGTANSPRPAKHSDEAYVGSQIEQLESIIAQKEQQIRALHRSLAGEQQRMEHQVAELLSQLQEASSAAEKSSRETAKWKELEQTAREEATEAQSRADRLTADIERHALQARKIKSELAIREQTQQHLERQTTDLETRNAEMLKTMKAFDTWAKELIGEKDAEISNLSVQLQSLSRNSSFIAAMPVYVQTDSVSLQSCEVQTQRVDTKDALSMTDDELLGFNPYARLKLLEGQVSLLKRELEQVYKAHDEAESRSAFVTAKELDDSAPAPRRNLFNAVWRLFLYGSILGAVLLVYSAAMLAFGACSMSVLNEYLQNRLAPSIVRAESFPHEYYYNPHVGGFASVPSSSFVPVDSLQSPEFFELKYGAADVLQENQPLNSDFKLVWRPSFLNSDIRESIFSWISQSLEPFESKAEAKQDFLKPDKLEYF